MMYGLHFFTNTLAMLFHAIYISLDCFAMKRYSMMYASIYSVHVNIVLRALHSMSSSRLVNFFYITNVSYHILCSTENKLIAWLWEVVPAAQLGMELDPRPLSTLIDFLLQLTTI